MGKQLTADEIFESQDFKTESVDVPEWGGCVTIRSLCALDAIEIGELAKAGNRDLLLKLVVRSVVGADGAPLFTDDDIERLWKKSPTALMRVQSAALALNGLTKDEAAAAKNV